MFNHSYKSVVAVVMKRSNSLPNTRSGAIDSACEFTCQMLPALQHAVEHPDMTKELAEILSTDTVLVKYEVSTDVSVE